MKARSPAQQTFVLQLTNGCGMYLPTALAIEGGSYSGLLNVNKVDPEGGQILADQSVRAMQALFQIPSVELPSIPQKKLIISRWLYGLNILSSAITHNNRLLQIQRCRLLM